jgi:ABC-type dipeptide/oligopeptide/nickel transport system permease component
MIHHLLRRLAGMGLVLLAVTFITFAALAAAPGDAAGTMVGDSASAEQMALLRQSLGLDGSLLVRYQRFLGDLVLHGDLGRSLISGRPVSQLLLERLPYTVLLAVSAISLAVLLGAPLGMAAALRAGTRWDTTLMGGAAFGLAVPVFWSSLLLMLLFSLRLRWLPVAGAGSVRHLVLPAVALALPTAAIVARLLRASVLDTLHADFVRTAHAKGLASHRVFSGHVLRNSLIPAVTILGLQLGHLLGGAFVVETIFGWPGVGRLAVQAIFDRDTPVVLGAALTIAAIYLLINLAVDVIHGVLDPRVGRATL